jgi:hypothetical protein
MNDMDLIRELRPGVPLPDAAELAPARSQLAAAIATEISAHPRSVPARRSLRPSRRLALAGVAVTAVAAGVAAALIVVPGHGGQPGTAPVAAPGRSDQSGARPAATPTQLTGHLTAARFLETAARAVLRQPAAPPSPGQFVYSETEGPGGTSKYQIWQSADGTKPGIVVNAQGVMSLPSCSLAQAAATHCATTAGYLPGLPTKPGAVLGYLTRIGLIEPTAGHKAIPNWVANDLGKEVDSLLSNTYLRPAQRAALFRYMARTPGFTVAPHAVDALGRHGVGIAWTYQGGKAMIIFNPRTYAYLGDRTWAPASSHVSGYDGAALVKFAVVSKPPAKVLAPEPSSAKAGAKASAQAATPAPAKS